VQALQFQCNLFKRETTRTIENLNEFRFQGVETNFRCRYTLFDFITLPFYYFSCMDNQTLMSEFNMLYKSF